MKMAQLVIKEGSRPPWVGLGAAVWVQLGSGNPYSFPLFSPALKSVLGLSQQQITMLGVAVDIGENAGILPGIVCNKFSPWVVLSMGACACFLGYGLVWLNVTQILQNFPFWLLWVAILVGSNSAAWFSTTVIVTNMRNFPLSRGTVAGLMKGYSGLSAAIFTEIFSLILNKSASNFLLFLAIGLPIITSSMMYLIRLCAPESASSSEDSSRYFLFTQVSSILLGIYLLATKIIDSTFVLSKSVCYTFIAIMVVFMMAPLAIPLKMTIFPSSKKVESNITDVLLPQTSSASGKSLEDGEMGIEENSSETDIDTLLAVGEGAVRKKKRRPHRGEDFKFKEAMIKADFWLLWLVYFLGAGAGVTFLNNLAQIGYAQGNGVDTSLLLSLFSFCNFMGRLGGGAVSEHFVRYKSIPRTTWMSITQTIMGISFLLYTLTFSSSTLYLATGLVGICFGVQFTTMIPTASELFGLKNFGVIYNFMLLGNPIGAFLFSGLLAGNLYDYEEAKQGGSICLGPDCFRVTFLVLVAVCGVGVMLGLYLTVRIRPVYQMLYSSGSSHRGLSVH